MEKSKKTFHRYCFVPNCKNTIINTPDKIFFPVPRDAKTRKQWCTLIKRDDVSPISCLHCCSDHFNVDEDTVNYVQYKIMEQQGIKVTLRLKEGAVPHLFQCHKPNVPPPVRKGTIKRHRKTLVNEALPAFDAISIDKCDDDQARPSTSHMDVTNDIEKEPIEDCDNADIEMGDNSKVFVSTIIREENSPSEELYDLLKVTPANPLLVSQENSSSCEFFPKNEKQYTPKQKSKVKVKTVQEIRGIFERDTLCYLVEDLEKQQNILFQKIKTDTIKNKNTKSLAMNMLDSGLPISRTTWLMLTNVNPKQYKYSTQFVLWNGKQIQINGSRGGDNKFICSVDLSLTKYALRSKIILKKSMANKRKSLLRNSLNIKFKPGPLGRKNYLDVSHQKYHVGGIELMQLPIPGLDIQPAYGTRLEPTIAGFLDNLRDKDGTISKKWAEFSVSVLGKLKKSKPTQLSKEYVAFNLGYKCDQRRILMRRDRDQCFLNIRKTDDTLSKYETVSKIDDLTTITDVKDIVSEMLDSIEVHFEQDNMFSYEESSSNIKDSMYARNNTPVKEKPKKKYGELDRLDVTIIQMPETQLEDSEKICDKSFCMLGCICESLECKLKLKQHCGLRGCMFECKCDFSKYTAGDLVQNECSNILPGLINLNYEITNNLSKEEKKFHQTVILTGEKSILLKSQKRNCKITRKYEDYYTNMSTKNHHAPPKILKINCLKLNCENIEPWCMVHNLYKCFCKGKIITISNTNLTPESTDDTLAPRDTSVGMTLMDTAKKRTRIRRSAEAGPKPSDSPWKDIRISEDEKYNRNEVVTHITNVDTYNCTCARAMKYIGRKFSDGYYYNTNNKISEMEKNDHKLHKKMISLMNPCKDSIGEIDEVSCSAGGNCYSDWEMPISSVTEIVSQSLEPNKRLSINDEADTAELKEKCLPNKNSLVSWLEANYKIYKERLDQGSTTALKPPKTGKVMLYSWDFILDRYRERKNIFLVTKTEPYRIFLGVTKKNPFFDNCMNIDDIRLADIDKYPITIKKLLSNANCSKDHFCILRGLASCWELASCVTKLNEIRNEGEINEDITFMNSSEQSSNGCDSASDGNETNEFGYNEDNDTGIDLQTESQMVSDMSMDSKSTEISKWFVMTIENDFTEIQFFRRGFFVKFESIMKAINVARVSGKTVRLSSQSCEEKPNSPQFGLYAIPNTSERCVFIGPYGTDETLGIETVRTVLDVRKKKKTRGVWITTNTVDNSKVLDNPMSFILQRQYHETVPLVCDSSEVNLNEEINSNTNIAETGRKREAPKKPVKPIKIRKTDGFYLSANGMVQKKSLPALKSFFVSKISQNSPEKSISINEPEKLPKKPERGMFILKPEEINKKVLKNNISFQTNVGSLQNYKPHTDSNLLEVDIEEFIKTSTVFFPSTDDALTISLISDDEEDNVDTLTSDNQDVFIQSSSIEGLGWIRAKRNNEGLLSFQFPGFSFSAFQSADETFSKINKVFSRRIYIPKNITLTWEVVESVDESKHELKTDDLNSEFNILTKQGIQHKNDLVPKKGIIKTYSRRLLQDASIDILRGDESASMDKMSFAISELEEKSSNLEDETHMLWNKTISNKSEIINKLLNMPNNMRETMAESLENIREMSQI